MPRGKTSPVKKAANKVASGVTHFVRDEDGGVELINGSAVDHPKHYNEHPSGVECIDIVEHFNFNIGNAIKYLWRAGSKGRHLEDLQKAHWYITRELERLAKDGQF